VKKLVAAAGCVSLFFLFASTVKIFGRPQGMFEYQLEHYFIAHGLSREIMRVVGLAELFGAVTIWYHRTHWIGLAGAAALVVVTTGAMVFHLRFDTAREAVPAVVMLALSGYVLLVSGRDQLNARARTAASSTT
jgi:hypothetical protein